MTFVYKLGERLPRVEPASEMSLVTQFAQMTIWITDGQCKDGDGVRWTIVSPFTVTRVHNEA